MSKEELPDVKPHQWISIGETGNNKTNIYVWIWTR